MEIKKKKKRLAVAIYSFNTFPPLEGVAKHIADSFGNAEVISCFVTERWRTLKASGMVGRAWARAASLILYPLQALVHIIFKRPEIAIVTTNPFFLPFLMVVFRKIHRRPVIALIYDLFPDAFETGEMGVRGGPLERLAVVSNRFMFTYADGIVFIGERMSEHARVRYGEPRRWTVIEVGAETDFFVPVQQGNPKAQTSIEQWCGDKLIISYVGHLGPMHDWHTMAEALPKLLALWGNPRKLGIVVAAFGTGVAQLLNRWDCLSPDAVYFSPPLPDKEWARLLAKTDISIVTLKEAARDVCIPSKAFSAMAAGNALVAVASAESDLAKLIRSTGCGQVVDPGDVDSLAETLRAAFADQERLAELKRRSLAATAEKYCMEKLSKRWLDFFRTVREEARSP